MILGQMFTSSHARMSNILLVQIVTTQFIGMFIIDMDIYIWGEICYCVKNNSC